MTNNNGNSQSKNIVLSKSLVLLMAAASGITVANLYYVQPLLGEIASSFHISQGSIGTLVMLIQIGYALGMFFLLPLGDVKERSSLIIVMLICACASLFFMSVSKGLLMLVIFSFAIGISSIVPQLIVPFAAHHALLKERGKIIGIVMSGLLIGILLSRTFSGIIGAAFGWRVVYRIAAGMMILLAILLKLFLPKSTPDSDIKYGDLLKCMWILIKKEPVLREASITGAMIFATFSVFWSTMVFFLESPVYHLGTREAGLFGLVGVAGALAASIVGHITDRKSPKFTLYIAIALSTLSYISFITIGYRIWGLIIGVIILDLGTQSGQISNQARIYALDAEAHNRINTIYMVSYFIGGALGSFTGSYAWGLWGWPGVCTAGLLFQAVAICVLILSRNKS